MIMINLLLLISSHFNRRVEAFIHEICIKYITHIRGGRVECMHNASRGLCVLLNFIASHCSDGIVYVILEHSLLLMATFVTVYCCVVMFFHYFAYAFVIAVLCSATHCFFFFEMQKFYNAFLTTSWLNL